MLYIGSSHIFKIKDNSGRFKITFSVAQMESREYWGVGFEDALTMLYGHE